MKESEVVFADDVAAAEMVEEQPKEDDVPPEGAEQDGGE